MLAAAQTSSSKRPHIPWRRFWCPLGGTINCGDDGRGFLADPEGEYTKFQNPNVHPLEKIVPEIGPLILCGDPGIGKTTELKLAKDGALRVESPNELISLNFRQHIADIQEFERRTTSSNAWGKWRTGNHRLTLMIDGIDEGLIRIPAFVSALTGHLEEEPINRLRLILTCRSAEWPQLQGERLLALWPSTAVSVRPVHELCPLRYVDVSKAAEAWEINQDRFAEELFRAQAVGLATRPVTLFFLLDEFRRYGEFPSSHREIYRRGIQKLINEVDSERTEIRRASKLGVVASSEIGRINAAQRIATLALCCGKRSVLRSGEGGTSTPSQDLILSQCVPSSNNPSYPVFEEVIESALFTSVGEERFGFLHQTFAECIASMKLKALPLPQVRTLLMQRDPEGEHVVPQLIEVAAWTAGIHLEFCSHLLQVDPTALLHCDVSVLSNDLKEQLVAAILHGADTGHILEDFNLYRFFSTLKHPHLAQQLRPFIGDATHSQASRRMAIEMVVHCRLDEFCSDFLEIVSDHQNLVREDAARAACEIMPASRLAELEPLAREEAGPDPQQSIRGYALRRLVPARWSVAEALPHFVARADSHYLGSYAVFLEYKLPELITINDIGPCLDWLALNLGSFDSLSSRNKFTKAVVHLALRHLDQDEVSEALGRLWLLLAQEHLIRSLAINFDVKQLLVEDKLLCRQLLCLLMSLNLPPSLHGYRLTGELDLVTSPDDFDWLLNQLEMAQVNHQGNWAEIVANHIWHMGLLTACWDKFLRLHASIPALAERLQWFRAWSLDEPLARQAKARWLRDKRSRDRLNRLVESRKGDDPRPIRLEMLEKARSGDSEAWYELWRVLHWGDESSEHDDFYLLKVEEYKGWQLLDDTDQNLVRHAARRFLDHFAVASEGWEPNSDYALASTAALWLLRESIISDPSLRAILPCWIRLFSAFHDSDRSGGVELFSILNEASHQSCVATLFAEVRGTDIGLRRPLSLRIAKSCWDARFDAALRQFLDEIADAKMIGSAIDEWRNLSPVISGGFALEKAQDCLARVSNAYPLELKELLVAALMIRPVETFVFSRSILADDHSLGTVVWSSVLSGMHIREDAWLDLWPDDLLAELYIHLMQVLPKTGDPLHDGGFVAPRSSAAWMRDRIPSKLAARATRISCAALQRLVRELPEQALGLRWTHRNALVQCRRNEWNPPVPEVVARLLDNSESRFITSEAELKEVVVESLHRFQLHLTKRSLPAVEELWSRVPQPNSRVPRMEHKDEAVLQTAVARWLTDDLGPKRGILVNCEVQPRPGSFTDIYVEGVKLDECDRTERMTVVIEVKGCWHRHVRTALQTQLIDGYLRPNSLNTGIYLIGWYVCAASPGVVNNTGHSNHVAVQRWLDDQIAEQKVCGTAEDLAGVVLDCSLPTTAPSQ